MSFYHNWGDGIIEPVKKQAKTFEPWLVRRVIDSLKAGLGGLFKAADQVGSSYILGKGMDLDIVVCLHSDAPLMQAEGLLTALGYEPTSDGSGDSEDDNFRCFRHAEVNVMLTADEDWYWNFVKSAEVCKALGLTSKWQRVAVHRVLMDDEDADKAVSYAKERYP